MAILIEDKKKNLSPLTLILVVMSVGVIGLGVYLLFFSPAPVIDLVIPIPLKVTEELVRVEFDPVKVVNSASFRALRPDTSVSSVGSLGRDNPFLGF